MENDRYENPRIVIEGDLEVQAGTETGDLTFDLLDELL
jgi:hypothetical protein